MARTGKSFTRRIGVATWGKASLKGNLLAFPCSLWFFLFLLVPVFFVVAYGFATPSKYYVPTFDVLTWEHYRNALDPDGVVIGMTIRTLIVSVETTILSALIAYPVAYLLARKVSEKWRGIFVGLIIIPFWISFVVQVYALFPFVIKEGLMDVSLKSIGLGGLSTWLLDNFGKGTGNIVPLVLVYIWLPYMVLPLFTSLLKIDKELMEAAQDLGAGAWKTFWSVTFPLSFPGLVTGSILVFITAFGSFVEPRFFAGQENQLVGNYIYNKFESLGLLPEGSAASILVLVTTLVLLFLYAQYSQVTEVGYTGERTKIGRLASALWTRLSDAVENRRARRRKIGVIDTNGGHPEVGLPRRGFLERLFDSVAQRHGKRLLSVFTMLVLLSFYVPLVIVVVFSFNYGSNLAAFTSFSLRWYFPDPQAGAQEVRALFGDPEMLNALKNSFIIGLASTAISLIIGTLAAMAIARYEFRGKSFLNLMLYNGLVIPSIVLGISIFLFIIFLNTYVLSWVNVIWKTGYESIIVGHTTFNIPIVIVVVLISLREFDRSLEEAAMNLGADEFTTFFRVTLPVIKPALISAALLSFTFSFDELIVTIFLKGQGIETLPVVMWSTLLRKIPTPELNAASTLILLMSVAFVLLANKVQRGGALFRI